MLRVALLTALLVATLFVGCATRPASVARPPELVAYDFGFLLPAGEPWRGTLTYRDYSTDNSVTIPSTLLVTRADTPTNADSAFNFAIGYDEEPHANGASRLEVREQGKVIALGDSVEGVVSHARVGDDVVIITQSTGEDDAKPAMIRKVYTIAARAFSLQKLVKFEGQNEFFERHTYRWTR